MHVDDRPTAHDRPTCGIYEALWLARLHAASAHALYVHVPFCVRKCAYCDFASWPTPRGDALMGAYVAGMKAQLEALRAAGLLAGVETAYLGGGTPTLLGPRLLGELVGAVRTCCPDVRELTCEANPESLSDEVLATLGERGATRLSIGVQSLDDAELAELGRVHDGACARERVAAAVRSGLAVSVDLMCATPGQTDESWTRTLEEALAQGVGHVSVYPLQIEEGTPLAVRLQGTDPAWNDPDVQAARMERAEALLDGAGFVRYEVASYARDGQACRHNQAYWTARPYLGLGVGASSMLAREAYERLQVVCPQLPALPDDVVRVRIAMAQQSPGAFVQTPALADAPFDLELLTQEQAAAEDLMLAMRMTAGVDPGLYEHARRVLGPERMDPVVEDACVRRLAAWRGGRLAPTREGWLLGNELYGMLWSLSPGEVREVTCP